RRAPSCSPAWTGTPGSTSCTPTPCTTGPSRPRTRRCARPRSPGPPTASASWPPWRTAPCGPPSSTPRSPATPAPSSSPTGSEPCSDMAKLELLPAVDVRDGQAVRLVHGESGTETSYGSPLDAALAWQRAGAEWLHLVDLDAAFGRGSNRELLAEVTGKLDVKGELSGGIRDDESLEAALATGCARANIGTAALEDPDWCRKIVATHGDKIAVGLDVRGTTLAARGWTRDGGDLWEVLARLEEDGCPRYVVTDVTKDGTLRGPNTELLREVCAKTDNPV